MAGKFSLTVQRSQTKKLIKFVLIFFPGHQSWGLDRCYVLCSRCTFILELALLCSAHCGNFLASFIVNLASLFCSLLVIFFTFWCIFYCYFGYSLYFVLLVVILLLYFWLFLVYLFSGFNWSDILVILSKLFLNFSVTGFILRFIIVVIL